MRIIFSITILFLSFKVHACDGCNISTGFINVDPVNYISFRHRNNSFKGEEVPFFRHTGDGGELLECFLNYEIVTKYFAGEHLFLQSFISAKQTIMSSKDIDENRIGLSDPIVLIGYQNFEVFKKWQFNYNLFGGFDIGLGEYNSSLHQEYSPGSKTSDVMVGSELMARFVNWGMVAKLNYKKGFENKYGYQFGQVINTSIHSGYYHERGNLMYIPLVGLSFESNFIDYNNDKSVRYSSSNVLFADLGMNIMFSKKLILGGKYQITVFKDVPGWSKLKLDAFELEISYILGE